jgi:hypothetical protein
MGIFSTRTETAAEPAPPGGWFYDKPLPYVLTVKGETALGDPELEAEL